MQALTSERNQQLKQTCAQKGCNRQVRNAFLTYTRLGIHRLGEDGQRRFRISRCAADREEERALTAVNETLRLLTCLGKKDCVRTVRALWMQERGVITAGAYAVREGKNPRTVFRELAMVRLCWETFLNMP